MNNGKYFIIEIEEILQKLVVVKVPPNSDEHEAIRRAKENYKHGFFKLGLDDLKEVNYNVFEYNHPDEVQELIEKAMLEEENEDEFKEYLEICNSDF